MSDAKTRALDAYVRAYGKKPDHLIRAPGRVNIIGEHTDYNDGFVLPCAIERDTVVAIGHHDGAMIETLSCDYDAQDAFSVDEEITTSPQPWANYVRGMAKYLRADGYALSPSRMSIAGDVPLGSGLSSSAALEMAVGRALIEQIGQKIDPADLARIGQKAENQFVGCACGIMDQLISAKAQADHAMLIDCRTLECSPISIPSNAALLIVNSGITHSNSDGAYNERRAQCEKAAHHYGVKALRDIDEAQLKAGKADLDALCYKRARHVVSENARTLAAADALRNDDLRALGQLMRQSHASMRDDFEITIPEIDRLADIMNDAIAQYADGAGGARMTGGGFGGCLIAIAPSDTIKSIIDSINNDYRKTGNQKVETLISKASQGMNIIKSATQC